MSPKRIRDPKDPELFLVNGIYYYRGTPKSGGKEIERSLGVDTRGLALQAKKELLIELRGLTKVTKELLFKDVAFAVIAEYDRRIQAASEAFKPKIERTKDQVVNYIGRRKLKPKDGLEEYREGHLLAHFKEWPVRLVNEDAWGEFIQGELDAGRNRNFGYDRRFMRQILFRAQRAGKAVAIPELKVPKAHKKLRRILTPEEIGIIYEKATGILKPLVLCMYKMGFRPGEVTRLRWERVDFASNTIELLEEDVKVNARKVKMNPQVRAMLLERRLKAEGSVWVFPTRSKRSRALGSAKTTFVGERPIGRYHKQWERLLVSCGIKDDPDVYCLRHTFLTECAKRVRGKELTTEEVTQFAGTSIAEFEKTYLHFTADDTAAVATLMDIGGAI